MAQESFDGDNVDNASGHSSAGHADTASSAGAGFERNKYGMYFFIRQMGTATYLTSDNCRHTEGTQIILHPCQGNNEKVAQIFFIDSYGALHHAASGLAVDIVDDVLCLRRRRPVSGRPNPWSRPLPEFSLVNSQLRVKFLSDPSLPSCTDDLYPDDSWATKSFLLASHTEKDFHFHPLSDFSPWIPPAMAGSFAYATSTRHEKDRRVLVEERVEDVGGARTSWEIVPYNKA
ncbi:hypothetical protein FIBSPDRAFT_940508 [Athelia psychrophila]|uniref:Ricin B lectin domain-containing protein n=1 Tax=Athelia psychrophila TaxID=1759441 RepID=A0A167VTG5_9AGAM|nr:hypothetical protein FIBSPDRAFT_940508 [Fibularhizoctonia sp. CBS 109695]